MEKNYLTEDQRYCASCEGALGFVAELDVAKRPYESAPLSRQGANRSVIKAFICTNEACEYRGLRIAEIEWDGISWKWKRVK